MQKALQVVFVAGVMMMTSLAKAGSITDLQVYDGSGADRDDLLHQRRRDG